MGVVVEEEVDITKGPVGVVLMEHIAVKSLQVGAVLGTFAYPIYVLGRRRRMVTLQEWTTAAGKCVVTRAARAVRIGPLCLTLSISRAWVRSRA